MKKQYRIIRTIGGWGKYKIQCKRWWFPFWIRVGFDMTFESQSNAERWLNKRLNPTEYKPEKSL